jgi:probable O-glycosylation ligase (exosortase A-associated)
MPDMRAPAPPRPAFGRGHYLMFAFAAWIIVTFFAAQYPDVSEPWVMDYVKIFLMFAASAIILRTEIEMKHLLLLAAGAIFYLGLEINLDYLATGKIKVLTHGHGGLDNNGAGLLLAMGIPLYYFLFEALTSRWRWLLLAGIPPVVHTVLMTYSRGAMVSLALATPLLVLRSRYRLWLALALILGGAIGLPFMAGAEIQKRFFTIETAAEADESAQARLMSWTAAIRIANDYPVFGVGVRNANVFSHQYGADIEGRTIHSQYLQIAADNGYVGLGIYLILLLGIWRDLQVVRGASKKQPDSENRLRYGMASGIESSMAVFCVGGVFLSLEVFELPFLLMLLGAQLALFQRAREALTAPILFWPGTWLGQRWAA